MSCRQCCTWTRPHHIVVDVVLIALVLLAAVAVLALRNRVTGTATLDAGATPSLEMIEQMLKAANA